MCLLKPKTGLLDGWPYLLLKNWARTQAVIYATVVWTSTDSWTVSSVANKILAIAFEWQTTVGHQHHRKCSNWKHIKWEQPDVGGFKFYTNEAAHGQPGKATAGGLILDGNGCWVVGFSSNIGVATALAAELWGLRDGNGLSGSGPAIEDTPHLSNILCDCKWLMQELWPCLQGRKSLCGNLEEGLHVHVSSPGFLHALLADDARGVLLPRLCTEF